ncbi:hypothetical protein [Rhizobium sp. Root482]|uniref:hypothetical protein n=1 Tax=Rhizobium sp. Root482 TaxID=1736543 RepID=UPI000A7D3CC1|nr:hypothetical protein [Rhizobium sp. Root482]
MRVSASPDDPGYLRWIELVSFGVQVTLNGEIIEKVITADEEEGFIIRIKCDDDGEMIVSGYERLEGSVKVTWGQA